MNFADHGCALSHGERSASEADAKKDRESVPDAPNGAFTSHSSGLGIGVQAGAARSAARPAALPCQNSNNSNNTGKRYRLKRIRGEEGLYTSKDNRKAIWEEVDSDTIKRMGLPSSAEAKSAFHLRHNVSSFVQHWGRNHCLFFTITDEANLHPTQFARRWNSLMVRNGSWIRSYIRVLEPQKQGRPHYHLLIAVEWDTQPDRFDWESFDGCQAERRINGPTSVFRELRARYKASAAPELVLMWSMLRKVLPRYGLGRAELLPLRKGKPVRRRPRMNTLALPVLS